MKQVRKFRTGDGRVPFDEWLDNLDFSARAIVHSYVERFACGGARRNVKWVKGGGGIFEIVINRGPGYRVYFGELGNSEILILTGGIKKSQARDIERAREFWRAADAKTSHV